jgi:hypothetical protein
MVACWKENRRTVWLSWLSRLNCVGGYSLSGDISLLKRLNTPPWAINVLTALLTNVKAIPILSGRHNTIVEMHNGLKQGYPLSPILFNLAIDPFMSNIAHPSTLTLGFADDINVAMADIRQMTRIGPAIDRFNAASGSKTSKTKSHLLTTQPSSKANKARSLPRRWKFLEARQTGRYLGVPFGRSVFAEDVFAKAMTELARRTASYLPLRSCYSLQSRIIITNTFLLSTLNYVQ